MGLLRLEYDCKLASVLVIAVIRLGKLWYIVWNSINKKYSNEIRSVLSRFVPLKTINRMYESDFRIPLHVPVSFALTRVYLKRIGYNAADE